MRTVELLKGDTMYHNFKGQDLLSKQMMAFGGLFTAFTTGGIAPLVAMPLTLLVTIFLVKVA